MNFLKLFGSILEGISEPKSKKPNIFKYILKRLKIGKNMSENYLNIFLRIFLQHLFATKILDFLRICLQEFWKFYKTCLIFYFLPSIHFISWQLKKSYISIIWLSEDWLYKLPVFVVSVQLFLSLFASIINCWYLKKNKNSTKNDTYTQVKINAFQKKNTILFLCI